MPFQTNNSLNWTLQKQLTISDKNPWVFLSCYKHNLISQFCVKKNGKKKETSRVLCHFPKYRIMGARILKCQVAITSLFSITSFKINPMEGMRYVKCLPLVILSQFILLIQSEYTCKMDKNRILSWSYGMINPPLAWAKDNFLTLSFALFMSNSTFAFYHKPQTYRILLFTVSVRWGNC